MNRMSHFYLLKVGNLHRLGPHLYSIAVSLGFGKVAYKLNHSIASRGDEEWHFMMLS